MFTPFLLSFFCPGQVCHSEMGDFIEPINNHTFIERFTPSTAARRMFVTSKETNSGTLFSHLECRFSAASPNAF